MKPSTVRKRSGAASERPTAGVFAALVGTFLAAVGLAFDPRLQVQFTLPKVVVFFFAGAALLAAWAWRLQRGLVRPVPRTVLVPALALAVWWLATLPFAIDRHTALFGMHGRYNGFISQASLLAVFLAIASSGLSRDAVHRLTMWFVAAAVPLAAYAAAQAAGWDLWVWPNIRPGSTIGHPVPLAAILSLVLPFALTATVAGSHRLTRWAAGGASLLLLVAVAGTLSRGPWIGLAAALAVMAVNALRNRPLLRRVTLHRGMLAVAAATIAVFIASAPMSRVVQRLSMFGRLANDPSFSDRFVTYRAALDMIRDHPVTGIGFESYGLLYPRYRPIEPEALPADTIPTMVHNGYLQSAVTGGIPGLLLYLALISAIVWTVWPDRIRDRTDALMPTAFLAGLTSYLVQDLSGWLELSLSAFFWCTAGAAVAYACAGRSPQPLALSPARRWLFVGATVAGAMLLAAAGSRAWSEVQADRLFREADSLDIASQWPQIESRIEGGLRLTGENAHYLDAGGILTLRRFHAAPSRVLYDRAAALFERAALANRFDPYIVVNRIELEAEALTSKTIPVAAGNEGDRAVRAALEMDPNNATVHRALASFRLATGQFPEAITAVAKAKRLRPHEPRISVVEGDLRRALGDRAAAADAYRTGAGLFERGTMEWVDVERRLVVTLAEMGRDRDAAEEARQLVELAPSDALSRKLLEVVEAGAVNARQ